MTEGKTLRVLGSWVLTVVLLLLLCASYLYFTFGEDPFNEWFHFLLYTPLGLLAYSGLIANLLFASARVIRSGMKEKPVDPGAIRSMDSSIAMPVTDGASLEGVKEWMGRNGFPVSACGEGICSVKGRLSFLPGTAVRAGLILLMVSVLFSVHLRKTEVALLHEGEGKVFLGRKVILEKIRPNLPEEYLQVGEGDAFKLHGLSASVFFSGKAYKVTPGFPVRIGGLYFRIIHLGFSHPLSLRSAGGFSEKVTDLDVLPPGKTDIAEFPAEDLFLTLSLYPEKTISKGILKGRQFNLGSPSYYVVAQKGREKKKSEGTVVKSGGEASVGGDLVAVGRRSLYVTLSSVYDPALPGAYGGVALILGGALMMLARLFWYRREFSAVQRDGVTYVGYTEEFYKKWGIQKFHGWKEELERAAGAAQGGLG